MDMLIDKQERHDARGLAAVVAHIVVNLGSADVYIYIYLYTAGPCKVFRVRGFARRQASTER